MVSKIWAEMFTTDIHLLQFQIQSHLQKRGLWMLVHQMFRTQTEGKTKKTKQNKNKKETKKKKQQQKQNKTKQNKKKSLKFLTLHSRYSPFCPFLIKILLLNCHPEYLGIYFSQWNHQMRFKIVHSNTKNAKSIVHQSQVCSLNAQPIPLPLIQNLLDFFKATVCFRWD